MRQKSDGMTYAPQGKPDPVVKPGEFVFAAAHLEHGHIYGQCNGLLEAGATLKWVYDPDPQKVAPFRARYPQAKAARTFDEVLADQNVRLVAATAAGLAGELRRVSRVPVRHSLMRRRKLAPAAEPF